MRRTTDVNKNTNGIELTITRNSIEAHFCKDTISAYAIISMAKEAPEVSLSIMNGMDVIKDKVAHNFRPAATRHTLADVFSSYLQELREYVYSSMNISIYESINMLSLSPALKINLGEFADGKAFSRLVKKQKYIDAKNIARLIKDFM